MIGRKNIVFGFLYLVLTAALGLVMVNNLDAIRAAGADKQAVMGPLQLAADTAYEDPDTLEPMSADKIARLASGALLGLNKQLNAQIPNEAIKGGPHAHGNLEALLNIVFGLVLLFLGVANWFKQLISWAFIAGAVLHSGALYLVIVFEQAWAVPILNSGVGPILILAGLLLAGIASAIGFRAQAR